MPWTCYIGQPIEFKAKYDGVKHCISNPDLGQFCGLKHVNLGWLEPDDIHIGKGFHVRPDLPHGLTYWGPEGSFDLELVLTGPRTGTQRTESDVRMGDGDDVPALSTIRRDLLQV